jgi:excisionase family DNA binding protein
MMTDKLTLGIPEVANLIGLSPWTIRKMVASGKLPSVRINRRVLIETVALRDLIEKSKQV